MRRRDGEEGRLYTHNGTKALIRHLHKASHYIIPGKPEVICQKRIVRTYLVLADNNPGTPQKVVVVAVLHHISRATARAGPSKHVGGLMGTVDVVVVVIVAVAHHVSWAAVRAGSSKHMDRLMGRAERPIRICLLYTSPSPRDGLLSRMPSSA